MSAPVAERNGPTAGSVRSREASLLVGAIALPIAGLAILGWSVSPDLSPTVTATAVSLAVIATVAHLAVRAAAPDADPVLLPLALLLNGFGLVLVRRVDLAAGSSLAAAQTGWTTLSVGALILTLLFVRRVGALGRLPYSMGLATILLLLAPLVPGLTAGVINGARLWIDLGGMRFQPGELAKITMVLFLAGYLERNRSLLSVATQRVGPLLIPAPRHLAPVLLAAGAALAILAGLRDLGSALLFFMTFIAMLYVATGRVAYPVLGLGAFGAGATLVHRAFDHVQTRVAIWLDPWADVSGAGYQIAQSIFALATGGLTGTGLGLGRPQDVPFVATDAILVVAGEELGLLGATALLVAYLLLVVRGLRIAMTARDEFGTLLATGLAFTLAIQTFVIVGGLTRIVPLTGITLPFVSYGGSSLLANHIIIALLLRISDESRGAARGRDMDAPSWFARRVALARDDGGGRERQPGPGDHDRGATR
ncbi:MAG: hypothetical protein RLZZ272_984 [Actinomycetota bacterium]